MCVKSRLFNPRQELFPEGLPINQITGTQNWRQRVREIYSNEREIVKKNYYVGNSIFIQKLLKIALLSLMITRPKPGNG